MDMWYIEHEWGEKGANAVLKSEQAFRAAVAIVVICAAVGLFGWGLGRGEAEEEALLGRYQVAVPDLVLDTATGRLANSQGQVLEQAINASGTEVGRYSVDGYVTAVTRAVGLDVMNQPVAMTSLVKGYAIADTQTGHVVKQRIYYSRPLQQSDL